MIRPIRRKDRQTSTDTAFQILEQCPYATLSMSADSQPYAVPISPVVLDGTVYFHCALQGQKLDFLGQNAKVCLTCVMDARPDTAKLSMFYQSAVAYGTAFEVTDDQEKHAALLAICQKYCPENMESAHAEINRQIGVTAVYRIEITRITGKARR